jgi:hypothetical protein
VIRTGGPDGKAHLQPELTNMLFQHLMEQPDNGQPAAHITARERSVLQLLAQGRRTKRLACSFRSASTPSKAMWRTSYRSSKRATGLKLLPRQSKRA